MKERPFGKQRQLLEGVFRKGLEAVHGAHCVADYLHAHPPGNSVCVVAIGKAASAMASGATRALGKQLLRGLLITRDGHSDAQHLQDGRFVCLEAGHPLPDARSLQAGEALCRFLEAVPADAEILFLVSGGASSLVEVLRGRADLALWQQMNRWLLASGLDISAINRVRRSVSLIKGGGLLEYTHGHTITVLLISDVAGDDPAVIGSGLLYPGMRPDLSDLDLPPWILALSRAGEQPAKARGAGQATPRHHVLANIGMALEAAAGAGVMAGYPARVMGERLHGDAAESGARLVAQLRHGPPGLYLWGGETTVRLPAAPGMGGRCQQLALAAACALEMTDAIVLLAAGTDGTDGPTHAAGAVVDPATLARGTALGLDARQCLRRADAGTYLQASADLLLTGPTGTNVADMVIGLKLAAGEGG